MDYTALYRKWRPGTFDEVVGQDQVVRILKNQIKGERISHAYLFCGPRGTGKTSTAKIFANAINCMDPQDGSPCGQCQVCKMIESESNIDIIEIDAASNTGVENIRDIRDKVKYPPSAGRYRVYIIDEVHMLSASAFNAFLKTLEEPPGHIVFILATTEPNKLPSTILSRCQRYDFRRITLKIIMERLKTIANSMGVEVEEEALETISRWSEGGMRDSIGLLDQCISFSGSFIKESDVLAILGTAGKEFLFDIVDNIMEGNAPYLLAGIDTLLEEGRDISAFLKDLVYHLRNLLIVKICRDPSGLLDVSQSTLNKYREQSLDIDQARLIRSIEILSRLEAEIKWNTSPRIMLEMAMVKICRPQDGKSIEDLRDRIDSLERQVLKIQKGTGVFETNANLKSKEDAFRDDTLGEDTLKKDTPNDDTFGEDTFREDTFSVDAFRDDTLGDDYGAPSYPQKTSGKEAENDKGPELNEEKEPGKDEKESGEDEKDSPEAVHDDGIKFFNNTGLNNKAEPAHVTHDTRPDHGIEATHGIEPNRGAESVYNTGLDHGAELSDEDEPVHEIEYNKVVNYDKIWEKALSSIRKDRIAIYPLLRETELRHNGRNKSIINLVFPSHQGFYVAAIEKEENCKYIEDLLKSMTGKELSLRCYTHDNLPEFDGSFVSEVRDIKGDKDEGIEYDIVKRAIDIFGEEYVELVDE